MDAQLKRGLLEVCVLACISNQESYGYKIIQDISQYIQMSEATLYPILRRLVEKDEARSRTVEIDGRLRKYYSITYKGQQHINEFIEQIHEFNKVYQYIVKSNGGREL